MKNVFSVCLALFFCISVSASSEELALRVDPSPGTYLQTVTLSVDREGDRTVTYEILEGKSSAVEYTQPIKLSAVPGEIRRYTVRLTTKKASGESLTKDFSYIVDRRGPGLPTIEPLPAYYTQRQVLHVANDAAYTILLDAQPVTFPLTIDAPVGEYKSFRFEVVPKADKSATAIRQWNFTVDRRGQSEPSIRILSPVAGVWANAQLIAFESSGVENLKWSLSSESDRWSSYVKPILLEKTGAMTLSVVGVSRRDGSIVKAKVEFEIRPEATPIVMPVSQWTDRELELAPPSEGWKFSWDEGKTWNDFAALRKENVRANTVRAVTVLLRKTEGEVPYRYLYVFDDRSPEAPVLTTWGGFLPQVAFSGASDAMFEARWEGGTTESSRAFGPSGSWNVPAGATGVKVKAIYPNGRESAESSLAFSALRSSTPQWDPLTWEKASGGLGAGGDVRSVAGLVPVFEVSDTSNVAIPTASSPLLISPIVPDLPRGSDRIFYARIAWRDDSGKVGPTTVPIAFRTDKKAPDAPTFQVSATHLSWTSPEEGVDLYYAVTDEPVRNLDRLSFQPYREAIAIPPAAEGQIVARYVHAYAQDAWGNVSPIRLNVVLGTDRRPFAFQKFVEDDERTASDVETSIADLSVHSKSRILVRPQWQGQADEIFCLVSASEDLPADWSERLLKIQSNVPVVLNPGQRKSFSMFWNAKNAGVWILEQPVRLRLTLDLALPEDPTIENRNPGDAIAKAWTIRATEARKGDRLLYTVSQDGSEPADPLREKASVWPGSLVLDVEEGTSRVFRLRMAVVSAAGLSREIEPLGPVKIDKTLPGAVTSTLEEVTVSNVSFVGEFSGTSDSIRYRVTENGEVPSWPDESSPTLKNGRFEFSGKPGERVLYRIRLRGFSETNRPGPVSPVYTVLVDRSSASSVSVRADGGVSTISEVRIQGLPDRPTVNSSIELTPAATSGSLRYELSEGELSAPQVSAFSKPFPPSLKLDVPSGTDRIFQLSAAVFDSQGRRISPVRSWKFRIDKIVPVEPIVKVITETRRPEVRLSATASDEVETYYRWNWKSFPFGAGTSEWSKFDGNSPTFRSPEDRLTRLSVESYTKDSAGNTSPIQSQSVLLDQNVVYVDSRASDGDGSRSKPFASLTSAFAKMRAEGKKILFVAGGTYALEKTQDVTNWSIVAGLDRGRWDEGDSQEPTTFVPSVPFVGTNLLESYEGTLELRSLTLQNSASALSALVQAQKTQVRVENVQFVVKGAVGRVWKQSGGSLWWKNSNANVQDSFNSSVIDIDSASITIAQLNLSAQKNDQPVFFRFARVEGTVSDVVVVSKFESGIDQSFSVSDSKMTFANVRLLVGEACDRSLGFQIERSQASLYNVEATLNSEKSNLAVQSESSRLETDRFRVAIPSGIEYNQVLVASNSELRLTYSTFLVASGDYQGIMSVQGGQLTALILSAEVKGGGKRAWGIQFVGKCRVDLQEGTWKLLNDAPGSCWIIDRPWLPGSTENRNEFQGWKSIQSTQR